MKYKISLALLGATMLFNSCENKPELVSGISKENMNLKVKPGDNFEEYVNGTWLKKNKIPADKSSYGVFDMLIDKSQKDVKEIIEEAAKQNATEGSDEQKVGDFFNCPVNGEDLMMAKQKGRRGSNCLSAVIREFLVQGEKLEHASSYVGREGALGGSN